MKLVIIACLIAVALAAPQAQKEPIAIISQDSSVDVDGTYQYRYESADGTKAEQAGQLRAIGAEKGEVSQGSFSFTDKEGNNFAVTYVADENGYQPQGAHLPVAPPIPEAIARSIEYNLAHPEEDKSQ